MVITMPAAPVMLLMFCRQVHNFSCYSRLFSYSFHKTNTTTTSHPPTNQILTFLCNRMSNIATRAGTSQTLSLSILSAFSMLFVGYFENTTSLLGSLSLSKSHRPNASIYKCCMRPHVSMIAFEREIHAPIDRWPLTGDQKLTNRFLRYFHIPKVFQCVESALHILVSWYSVYKLLLLG